MKHPKKEPEDFKLPMKELQFFYVPLRNEMG